MQTNATTRVKGTHYYEASRLFRQGLLKPDAVIKLEHQPDNKYDKNAIAVKHGSSGEVLGYLSKELAPKYAQLLGAGRILSAHVKNVTKVGTYIDIDVEITYQHDEQLTQKIRNSKLWSSVSRLEDGTAVYGIRNLKPGKIYIGSSADVKARLSRHVKELKFGNHINADLQSDFSSLGPDCFEASILERASADKCTEAEARHIRSYKDAGVSLYNRTIDGQGTPLGRSRSGSGAPAFGGFYNPPKSGSRSTEFIPYLQTLKLLSVTDLRKMRISFEYYIEGKTESERQNAVIRAENENIERDNRRNETLKREYRENVIKPAGVLVESIAGELRSEKVGLLSGLWTNYIDYSLNGTHGLETKLKIKDSPLNRERIESHKQALSNLRAVEAREPTYTYKPSKSLIKEPRGTTTLTLGGRKVAVQFARLDLEELNDLIAAKAS